MSRPPDRPHGEFLEKEAEHLFLRGFTTRQIAEQLGVGISMVNSLLVLTRQIVADGDFDEELAKLAAEGFTNLPTRQTALKKGGGRPASISEWEHAIRADYTLTGDTATKLAKRHGTYAQKVHYILRKKPSVLKP